MVVDPLLYDPKITKEKRLLSPTGHLPLVVQLDMTHVGHLHTHLLGVSSSAAIGCWRLCLKVGGSGFRLISLPLIGSAAVISGYYCRVPSGYSVTNTPGSARIPVGQLSHRHDSLGLVSSGLYQRAVPLVGGHMGPVITVKIRPQTDHCGY